MLQYTCAFHLVFIGTWCTSLYTSCIVLHLSVNALCERENMKHLEQYLEQTYVRHNGIGKQSLAPVKWPQVQFKTKWEQALKLDLKVGIRSTESWKKKNTIIFKKNSDWPLHVVDIQIQFCVRPQISNHYAISHLLPIYWYSGSNVRAVHDTSNIPIKVGLRPFEN